MTQINIFERAGAFAENKDVARSIREDELMPALQRNEKIVLNFAHVDATTQSFIHALISDALRQYDDGALENITFHKCNVTTKQIVSIVVGYMQEGMGGKGVLKKLVTFSTELPPLVSQSPFFVLKIAYQPVPSPP